MADFGANATYQFYRTERWLGRLKAIYDGTYTSLGNWDDPLDHVLSFFLNCYHIKDWLKSGPEWHDDVAPSLKRMAVEQFITETPALCICADLCNGNKHFQLNKPRSGGVPAFQSAHSHVDTTTAVPLKTISYTFRTQLGDVDAYALAQECFESWRKFIRESTPTSLQNLANRNSRNRPLE